MFNRSYARIENRVFGLFLLTLNLRVLKGLFYSFSTEDPIWFLQSGPAFFLLIGPLAYIYISLVISPHLDSRRKLWLHLILWLTVVLFMMLFIPFGENRELFKSYLLPLINGQGIVYILLSLGKLYLNYDLRISHKWLAILIISTFIILTIFAVIPFGSFVIGSISFSLIFYLLLVWLMLNKQIRNKIFIKQKVIKTEVKEKIDHPIVKKLDELLSKEKLYTNHNLKISMVAEKLDITPHKLSEIINEKIGVSFNELINKYRINETKELLGTETKYTIEAIVQMAGFNSKSAFDKTFRAHTGTTPSKYKA